MSSSPLIVPPTPGTMDLDVDDVVNGDQTRSTSVSPIDTPISAVWAHTPRAELPTTDDQLPSQPLPSTGKRSRMPSRRLSEYVPAPIPDYAELHRAEVEAALPPPAEVQARQISFELPEPGPLQRDNPLSQSAPHLPQLETAFPLESSQPQTVDTSEMQGLAAASGSTADSRTQPASRANTPPKRAAPPVVSNPYNIMDRSQKQLQSSILGLGLGLANPGVQPHKPEASRRVRVLTLADVKAGRGVFKPLVATDSLHDYVTEAIAADERNLADRYEAWLRERNSASASDAAVAAAAAAAAANPPVSALNVRSSSAAGAIPGAGTNGMGRRRTIGLSAAATRMLANRAHPRTTSLSRGRHDEPTYQQPLRAQDVRALFVLEGDTVEPFISVRRLCIVFRVEPLRAIILRDRVVLVLTKGMDSDLEAIEGALRHRICDQAAKVSDTVSHVTEQSSGSSESGLPFEFQALRALLDLLVQKVKKRDADLARDIEESLIKLKTSHAGKVSKALESLRAHKNSVNRLESQMDRVGAALNDVLEDDTELLYMQLTRLVDEPHYFWSQDQTFKRHTCEDTEVFFEFYAQEISELCTTLTLRHDEMEAGESTMMLKLNMSRNRLLAINTFIALGAMCFGFGSFIGSIFGMNLNNTHEESHEWFLGVTWTVVLVIVLAFACLVYILFRAGVFLI